MPDDGAPGLSIERRPREGAIDTSLSWPDHAPHGHEKPWCFDMTSQPSPKPTARNREFYLARMKACQAEAGETSLPNVRDRALRAAAAWQEMYQKAQQFDEKRQDR